MGMEIVYALGSLLVIGLFVLLIRRASVKQVGDGRRGRERLRDSRDEAADALEAGEEEEEGEEEEGEEEEEEQEEEQEEQEEDDQEPEPDQEELEADDEESKEQLRKGLAKTRGGFVAKLGRIFSRKRIDEEFLEELEQVLFTADIGPKTSQRIFDAVKKAMSREELTDEEAIWSQIRAESATILQVEAEPLDFTRARPFVLLTIGVNGVGKTTTIGKVAAKLTGSGMKVLLAAGDTFRAAAVEQLEIWGERAGAPVVKGKAKSDPSSVIFDAIKRAIEEDFDVVIADTAGRLHTKKELMEELVKVRRVCDKAQPGAPHETWLVLDATTGQNAIQQAQLFKEMMDITGIVLTKLDGTAKGGVILGICDELGVPVRFIGIGEKIEDLRPFDAEAFTDALYGEAAEPS